nr:MAG TPA: hypothetical protein [Caudoviricetes sp.]
MKYICRTLSIAYAHDLDTDKYAVLLGCTSDGAGGLCYDSKLEFDNPLEAWSIYIMRADALLRRRLGDKLAAEGKNRYTGRRPA